MQGEIHHVVNPDPYRGVFGSDAKLYAKDVQDHIDYGSSGNVAGFIAETIQVGSDVPCTIDPCVHSESLLLLNYLIFTWFLL